MRIALAVLLVGYGIATDVRAQNTQHGAGSVNGATRASMPAKDVRGDGKGLSISGAKISHHDPPPAPQNPLENYKISDRSGWPELEAQGTWMKQNERTSTQRDANANELPKLTAIAEALQKVNLVKPDDKKKLDDVVKKFNEEVASVKPNKLGPPNAAFKEIEKTHDARKVFLLAEGDEVASPTIAESAHAKQVRQERTKQKDAPGGTFVEEFKFEAELATIADKKGNVGPLAVAYGINRDPLAIEWDVPEFTLTLHDADAENPANLTLNAEVEHGGAAAALYHYDVRYRNYEAFGEIPTDEDVIIDLEDAASTLFDLSITLVNSAEGSLASFILEVPDGAGLGIRDNLGNNTLADVIEDFPSAIQVANGVLSFSQDYALTFTLPANTNSSLLFTRHSSGGVAISPETLTWDGGVGDWSDDNWSPDGRSPVSADNAVVNIAGSIVHVTAYEAANLTTVEAGQLDVGAGGKLASDVNVGAMGSLTGDGDLLGDVTVSGGTVAPGASVGDLTIDGSIVFGADSHFAVELEGVGADRLSVTGDIDLTAAGDSLDVTTLGPLEGSSWVIASYAGALTGTFDSVPAGYTVDYGTLTPHEITLILTTADFDGDGDVDGSDFLVWQRGAGTTAGAARSDGDANGDGAVDAADLAIWQSQFAATADPPASPVPEPNLLLVAGMALLCRRRLTIPWA